MHPPMKDGGNKILDTTNRLDSERVAFGDGNSSTFIYVPLRYTP